MARSYTLNKSPRKGSGIDFKAELNDQQYAAVTAKPGQQLVIAGAGSGKTRTLTYRVAYLLDNGIAPENILLLTFTNKASREMLDRVGELIPADISALWGGTFHSIGNKILRKHADRLGFNRSFSILDREDAKDLLAASIVDAGIDPKQMRFPKPDVVGDIASMVYNTGMDLEDLLMERYSYFAHITDEIQAVINKYHEKKKETNSMDFDDLLVKTLELLKGQPDLLETYQYQFQFILVDEYQDSNHLQSEIVDVLAGKHANIMVVGDDAQSIYSWRGANFENILKFPETYPDAEVFKIEQNYRSSPQVLALANAAISANKKQFKKALTATREEGKLRPALVKLNDPQEQANFVAQRILELRDEGVELDEIAVLYRAHFHAMEIQLELTNRDIPFLITSGLRFFEQAHIKDVASFIRFAVNRRDEVAFKRMVRLIPGLGNVAAKKLWDAWLACEGSQGDAPPETFSEHLLKMKVGAKIKEPWTQMAYTLDELIPGGKFQSPSEMIKSILGGVYDEYMQTAFKNYEIRLQDLQQLATYGDKFPEPQEFLNQLALLSGVDGDPAGDQGKDAKDDEKVTLSSVHQAKGLEYKAVFVIWLTDGMFPGRRVLESGDEDSLEEERRLFYVAVTRAKDELYLAVPMFWPGSYTGDVVQRQSRFLKDFPAELAEVWDVNSGESGMW